ncbi:MAG: hypothetical protein Q9208_004324 [Pyrenodesmia sp. 3 TL-2023]
MDNGHVSLFVPDITTLPFKVMDDISKDAALRAVERSIRRRRWFNGDGIRNPALGTLSHLPIDIRQMIYDEIHRAFEDEYPDYRPVSLPPRTRNWYNEMFYSTIYEHVFRPFNNSLFKKRTQALLMSQNVPALRETSATIRAECDRVYLASRVLKFEFGWQGTELFEKDYFSKAAIWIRRISITQPTALESHGWVKVFRKHNFPSLQSITVDFDHQHGYSLWSRHAKRLGKICYGPDCHIGPATIMLYDAEEGKHSHKTLCKHLRKLRGLAQQLVRDLHAFEMLTRLLAEKVPGAIVQLADHRKPCPLCHDYCQLILESARTLGGISVRPDLEAVLNYDDPDMVYRDW